jgi:EmrB/QacA subfamily drug resistance transporter
MFMAAIEGTIVATAMPSIAASLGGFAAYAWVFSSFLLMQAITTPVFGKLSDLYGRKPVFLGGGAVFLLGSVLCGLAPSMGALIGFRFVQGLGAGAMYPTITTLAGDLYALEERARVQGYLSSVWGVSAVVGPLVGGLIVQYAHWSWIFWLNVPFGLLAMLGVGLYLHEQLEARERRVDGLGAALFLVGVSALMLLLTQAGTWSPPPLFALGALAALGLGFFVVWERRAPEPMLDLAQWRDGLIGIANVASLTSGVMMIGLITYLPTYVQGVMGRSPLVAGFTLTSMSIGWPICSVLAGRLLVPLGPRATARIGGALGLLSGLLFVFLAPANGPVYAALASLLLGSGMGFLATTFIVAVQSVVPWAGRGVATATVSFMRSLGNALGAALLGGVLNLVMLRRLAGGPLAGRVSLDQVQGLLDSAGAAPGATAAPSAGAAGLDAALLDGVRAVLASGLHAVFLGVLLFTVITFALTLVMPRATRLR